MKKLVSLMVFLLSTGSVQAKVFDFSVSDGGFVSSGAPSWIYTGMQWQTNNELNNTVNYLSRRFIANQSDMSFSLNHSYSFEQPNDFFDGGIVEFSINSASFNRFSPIGGYPVAISITDGCDGFGWQNCWSGNSQGFVTDTILISGLAVGDTVDMRFHAFWDDIILANGLAWQLRALDVNGGVTADLLSTTTVPVPASIWLLGTGILTLLGIGRKRC
ncbi:MAG: hypothetical protein L3J75_17810 [Methylococcaceae bacterium]|nr:hypothetical protein [Methylococcaceae bacterium]